MDRKPQNSTATVVQVQRRLTITEYTLDDIDLRNFCPVDFDTSRECHGLSQTRTGLGRLCKLPVEILTDILLDLDVPSLLAFRQTSPTAIIFVDNLAKYSVIRQHCPNILRAALGLRANSFSCNTLYETLTTHCCATCNRPGNYLYLITCKRVCYFCFRGHIDYMPMSSTMAAKCSRLSLKEAQKRLAHVHSIPGRYGGLTGRRRSSRKLLFDRQAVIEAGMSERDPAICTVKGDTHDPRRHMAIITIPYLGRSIQTPVDWGLYCLSCTSSSDPETHFRNHYTAESILDHIDHHHPGAVLQLVPDRDRARPWNFIE